MGLNFTTEHILDTFSIVKEKKKRKSNQEK